MVLYQLIFSSLFLGKDDGDYLFQPVDCPSSAKYAGYSGLNVGLFTNNSFRNTGLSLPMTRALVDACNNAVTTNTWRGYKSARKHLVDCAAHTGIRMTFPMAENQVLCLIAYLYAVRGLKGSTVDNILSAVRMLHLCEGHPTPCLRPTAVTMAIKGFKNRDEEVGRGKAQRQPVTLKLLELLYINLRMDRSRSRKLKSTVLAVATLAFFGGFRGGELISKTSTRYDRNNSLLKQDIWLARVRVGGVEQEIVCVRLKSTKTCRSLNKGQVVEVFPNGTKICPVRCYKKYLRLHGTSRKDMPAFRTDVGWAFRMDEFNAILKELLAEYVPYGKITSHSFRCGLASLLAENGFTDQEIQAP